VATENRHSPNWKLGANATTRVLLKYILIIVVWPIFVGINIRGLVENEMFVEFLFHRFDACQ
jgi:hypothetical protein